MKTYKQREFLLCPPSFRTPGCPPAAEERVQGRAGEDARELLYDSRWDEILRSQHALREIIQVFTLHLLRQKGEKFFTFHLCLQSTLLNTRWH